MEYCKLQIGCMMVILYVTFVYIQERRAYRVKKREPIFETILSMGIIGVALDGITAYTVNHLRNIPLGINAILHMLFLCSMDIVVYFVFLYIVDITCGIPKAKKNRCFLIVPLFVTVIAVGIFMPCLYYCRGDITNYSMGIPVYICFIMVLIYMIATVILLFSSWKSMGRHKLVTVSTYVLATVIVAVYQIIYPQALITCLVPTVAIVGIYLNMENPLFTRLRTYNHEMVMGFATLVENRDGSTGGHIRRTTEYVKMLAEELKKRGFYKEELTKDFMKNLVMAAPMHDVGKIAIPDAILQKPGRLTKEEYEIMKTHAERGGKIIQETFAHMGEEYENMAYEVATYHHEKWNGKGYPQGLSRKEIPLCARIMAVADVFDAISANRCYRAALPLEECFEIIKKGSGQDFDPIIVEVFLDMENRIREVCKKENTCQTDEI